MNVRMSGNHPSEVQMIKTLCTMVLAFAVGGCSATGGGSNDPEVEQTLQALKTENANLSKQVGSLSNRAFDRASKAEAKRNLKGSSRVLRSSSGSLCFDSLVLGPLEFKKKARTFYLNIGAGTPRGGIEDHKSNLSTKRGAAAPAGEPDRVKKGPTTKKKKERWYKKTIKTQSGEHDVFIRKKEGN